MNHAYRTICILAISALAFKTPAAVQLDVQSDVILEVPQLSNGQPAAGNRVSITPTEFRGTDVFHTIYLPKGWTFDGPKLPIIFEYTGNYHLASGSTGEVEDARLGYGLSGGKYIWVSLPYISENHKDNAVTWWGDAPATVQYAKQNVPRIIEQFNADPNLVFLCGFSRGAIGVNYLGLHDDEIAEQWTAFITHDHFDGVKEWQNTTWGASLEEYRFAASERLKRVNGRPYLVSESAINYGTAKFVGTVLSNPMNFKFHQINTVDALGRFPNEYAKSGHNDSWLSKPSKIRSRTWKWMNEVVRSKVEK